MGAEYRLVPLGSRPFSAIHFIDIIARVAMMFGGVTPGMRDILSYAKERAKAIAIVFLRAWMTKIALVDAFRLLGIPVWQHWGTMSQMAGPVSSHRCSPDRDGSEGSR